MEWTVALFILAVVIVAIWLLIETKRYKHKVFAIFVIVLIVLFYISTFHVYKDRDINFKSVSGIVESVKLYFIWLGSIAYNFKTITANAIKMDWGPNNLIFNFSNKK